MPRQAIWLACRLGAAAFLLLASKASAAESIVLFDEGHGQRFLIEGKGPLQLSKLAEVFRENDLELRTHEEVLKSSVLESVDGLVISGPFQSGTREEVRTILEFIEDGGRLCVMLHIGRPVAELLRQLGIAISNGVIRETEGVIGEEAINFEVGRLETSSLFSGIDSFNIYGAWALLAQGDHSAGIASTGPFSWVDLNGDRVFSQGDAVQEFSVVVQGSLGEGRFVVFGDDAMFQNQFLEGNNRKLAENLARWLKGDSGAKAGNQIAP